MGRKFGFSWSWRRATGLSAAKGRLSRAIGIPLTKGGRQRKAGAMLGGLFALPFVILLLPFTILGAIAGGGRRAPRSGSREGCGCLALVQLLVVAVILMAIIGMIANWNRHPREADSSRQPATPPTAPVNAATAKPEPTAAPIAAADEPANDAPTGTDKAQEDLADRKAAYQEQLRRTAERQRARSVAGKRNLNAARAKFGQAMQAEANRVASERAASGAGGFGGGLGGGSSVGAGSGVCGAPTQDGGFCRRVVADGGPCYQHR